MSVRPAEPLARNAAPGSCRSRPTPHLLRSKPQANPRRLGCLCPGLQCRARRTDGAACCRFWPDVPRKRERPQRDALRPIRHASIVPAGSVDFLHDGARAGIDQHDPVARIDEAILRQGRTPIGRNCLKLDITGQRGSDDDLFASLNGANLLFGDVRLGLGSILRLDLNRSVGREPGLARRGFQRAVRWRRSTT